jgi:hypothetical protein
MQISSRWHPCRFPDYTEVEARGVDAQAHHVAVLADAAGKRPVHANRFMNKIL